jgi:Fe-S-cluster-containing dehydrogenase component
MQKCTMCVGRLDEGGQPACAANCPAEAILCDTPENISRIIRERYAEDAYVRQDIFAAKVEP